MRVHTLYHRGSALTCSSYAMETKYSWKVIFLGDWMTHFHQVLYGFREVAHQYGPNISLFSDFPPLFSVKETRSNVNNTHRMLLKSKKTEMNDVSCSNCRVIFLLWRYTKSWDCCTRLTWHIGELSTVVAQSCQHEVMVRALFIHN